MFFFMSVSCVSCCHMTRYLCVLSTDSLWPAVMDASLLLSISLHFPQHAFIVPLMHLKLQKWLPHHKNITPGQWHLQPAITAHREWVWDSCRCDISETSRHMQALPSRSVQIDFLLHCLSDAVWNIYDVYSGCFKLVRMWLASSDLGI